MTGAKFGVAIASVMDRQHLPQHMHENLSYTIAIVHSSVLVH